MLGEKGAVMTALDYVTKRKAEQQVAVELVRLAQERGLSLTGPEGLLKQLTKTVLETALDEEMTEHLGYEKHDPAGAGTGNIRNGNRFKTVLTDTTGPVELDLPRDRAATFEPQIVKKRQRRLSGVDEMVLSLYAKGPTGEISAHFAVIYGASVSKETISRIPDKVLEEMNEWAVRPLDETYAAVFIDAIVNAAAARSAFDELAEKWGQRYPAVIRLWDNAWSEFIPFLNYDVGDPAGDLLDERD
jgi:transposase-like protein